MKALRYHARRPTGKTQITATKPCDTATDLALAYTPGVATSCRAIQRHPANHVSPSTSHGRWNELTAGAMTMTHSRRTSFDCQLVDAYLVSLQSDIEAKWRDIRSIRDDLHLLMQARAGSSDADSEAVRTITERLDRMLSTNRIVRETLLELRSAAQTLAQDLDDAST